MCSHHLGPIEEAVSVALPLADTYVVDSEAERRKANTIGTAQLLSKLRLARVH